METEEAFVRAFVTADKQQRYIDLLASPKRRGEVLARLDHHFELNPATAFLIPRADQSALSIERLLRQYGAPDHCHLISSSRDLDAVNLPLREALESIVGRGVGTIVCCIPGALAYYEAEDQGQRFVLALSPPAPGKRLQRAAYSRR